MNEPERVYFSLFGNEIFYVFKLIVKFLQNYPKSFFVQSEMGHCTARHNGMYVHVKESN